jgi:hypothetical protein
MSAKAIKPQKYLALDPEHIRSMADLDAAEVLPVLNECLAFALSEDKDPPATKLTSGAKILRDQICAAVARRKTVSANRAANGEKGGNKPKQRKAKQSKPKQDKASGGFAMNTNPYHKEKVDDKSSTIKKQPPTIEQFKAMAVKAGVSEGFAVYLHGELESVGWTTANGSCVENPIRYLKSAWNAEQKKIRAARVSSDDAFGGIPVGRV